MTILCVKSNSSIKINQCLQIASHLSIGFSSIYDNPTILFFESTSIVKVYQRLFKFLILLIAYSSICKYITSSLRRKTNHAAKLIEHLEAILKITFFDSL